MKEQSAARAKGNMMGGGGNAAPHEGTKLRALYDLFMANKGIVIEKPITMGEPPGRIYARLSALRDFYGLDIRKIRNGHWVLAGEWFGRVYVDYIAQRLAEKSRAA